MTYKRVSIVYNQSLHQVQGINYVNNSFVTGKKYFMADGLQLDFIYAPDVSFDCRVHETLDLIGSGTGTVEYQLKRKARVFLREVLSSKYLLGACIKKFLNHTMNARRAVRRLSGDYSDYLIFQDLSSAEAYFSKYGNNGTVRTVLILHCSDHPLEQTMATFPGYYRHPFLKERALTKCGKIMNMVDKVVYLSEHAECKSILPGGKKAHIYNGVDDISGVVVKPPSTPLRFVCVASVTHHKGQLNIVEALSLLDKDTLDKIHLTIVGGGDEFEACCQSVEDKGLKDVVTLTGQRNDVTDILKDMDVFILPSLSEGMPMSILEAMRQGLYIMATPVGGIPEMIEEGYGEFVSRDSEKLAESIRNLVNNNTVTFESKQKSRERYLKDFTLSTMIERYSRLLLSL